MNRTMLKSKLPRAGVTASDLHVDRDDAIVTVDEAAAEVVA